MSPHRVPKLDSQKLPVPTDGSGGPAAFRDLILALETSTLRLRELQDQDQKHLDEAREQSKTLFLELIDIMDRLHGWLSEAQAAAATHDGHVAKWLSRLEMTGKLITKSLAKRHVTPLDLLTAPAGAVTVVGRVEKPEVQDEQVIEVIERGWMWGGELIRKASVVVAVPAVDAVTSSADAMKNEEQDFGAA